LRLEAGRHSLARLALLVRRELRLASELDALGFRLGPAERRTLLDAAVLELRGERPPMAWLFNGLLRA
jgi:hypothetical protein